MEINIGMPAYPTLQELRTAGWSLEQVSRVYGVQEDEIQAALTSHFLHGATADGSQVEGVVGDQLMEFNTSVR